MKSLSSLLTLGFFILLAGCVPVQPKVEAPPPTILTPPPVVVVRADNEFLAYALRYGALPADEQKKEHAQVLQAFNANKSNLTNRMKAALVLSLPGSRIRDNARAVVLLDDIQRDSEADADTKAIASLVKEYVSERQKLEENAAKLGQKLAEDQKRIDAMQLKADALQQRADTLQQKLDDLKNIERALTNRDQTKQK
jgi:hypothetical protein